MKIEKSKLVAVLLACSAWFSMQNAHAFFEDDEARRHILDLREKKADKASIIELESRNEALKQEVADLRGQVEILNQKVAEIESRQKDFYDSLDERLRHIETGGKGAVAAKPKREVVPAEEEKPAQAEEEQALTPEQTEQRDYDLAEEKFKAGNYKGAIANFSRFTQKYPESHRLGHAYYELGNAYYLQKDYKKAYINQNTVVKRFPRNPVAPDAMLNMATSQIGMNDLAGAKKTLTELTKKYPSSDAAKRAKGILGQL